MEHIMHKYFDNRIVGLGCLSACLSVAVCSGATDTWTACGWGGGGFYYAAAFDPAQDGVLYMGGDVNGVYKSEDHGRTWRIINQGLANYGVFSLAVDRVHPKTIYAATGSGLCKSIDGGERWRLLPHTGRKELRITGEKGKSIRAVAVDPADGQIVYAASPGGKVYKSSDGGQSWRVAYAHQREAEVVASLRVQFGKVNDQWFGGVWLPLAFPEKVASTDCVGFGLSFQGDGTQPRDCFLTLKTATGAVYRSKNLRQMFQDTKWRDVVLTAEDFTIDPEYAKSHPEQAKALSGGPDWSAVNRMDLACVGPLPTDASVAKLGKVFFALTRAPDGAVADVKRPIQFTVRDLGKDKSIGTYGNISLGDPAGGCVYSVAVADRNPSLILAATDGSGLLLSEDAGQTWHEMKTPKKAASAAFAASDPNIIFGAFFSSGVWKSTDKGRSWSDVSKGLGKGVSVVEVVVSPTNPQNVYAIGTVGWNGQFYFSNDGGTTWHESSRLRPDWDADPTLPQDHDKDKSSNLSTPTNLCINPQNPKELFISANWRPCYSDDGGRTWSERVRGADISCVTDIRFHGGRVYVSAMDEGTLVSADNGGQWRALWPLKYSPELSGHNWRLAVTDHQGVARILATASPWTPGNVDRVVLSEDGGKTFRDSTAGLPNYIPATNTMWGRGYARALAVDPRNPQVAYLGIDGDREAGHAGGGIFKSADGGHTWSHLANQPQSRRMFFGLAVDPTDSQRVYWGACGSGGGLHRSEDGGATWHSVFTHESWVFNVLVTGAGTVYCPGNNLWRSTDHGKTWKQLTHFTGGRVIVGLESNPHVPKTLWISALTWGDDADGGVFKTSDGGLTWQEITANLPYCKPMVLRFNPVTEELWAGGVGLYRIKQTATP
jgi:photosystem II stability/assembly factor-like uncharacterized protein